MNMLETYKNKQAEQPAPPKPVYTIYAQAAVDGGFVRCDVQALDLSELKLQCDLKFGAGKLTWWDTHHAWRWVRVKPLTIRTSAKKKRRRR